MFCFPILNPFSGIFFLFGFFLLLGFLVYSWLFPNLTKIFSSSKKYNVFRIIIVVLVVVFSKINYLLLLFFRSFFSLLPVSSKVCWSNIVCVPLTLSVTQCLAHVTHAFNECVSICFYLFFVGNDNSITELASIRGDAEKCVSHLISLFRKTFVQKPFVGKFIEFLCCCVCVCVSFDIWNPFLIWLWFVVVARVVVIVVVGVNDLISCS